MADNTKEVIIDGVRYVPATDLAGDTKQLLRALAATWWGWNAKEIDDPQTYKYLKIVVGDGFEEDEGVTLENFVAEMSMNQKPVVEATH